MVLNKTVNSVVLVWSYLYPSSISPKAAPRWEPQIGFCLNFLKRWDIFIKNLYEVLVKNCTDYSL